MKTTDELSKIQILQEATNLFKNPPKEYTNKDTKILSEAIDILLQEELNDLDSYEATSTKSDDDGTEAVPLDDQDLMLHDDDGNTYIYKGSTKELVKVTNYSEESPARPVILSDETEDEFTEASLLLNALSKE